MKVTAMNQRYTNNLFMKNTLLFLYVCVCMFDFSLTIAFKYVYICV